MMDPTFRARRAPLTTRHLVLELEDILSRLCPDTLYDQPWGDERERELPELKIANTTIEASPHLHTPATT